MIDTDLSGGRPNTDLVVCIEENSAAVEALGELITTTLAKGDSTHTHLAFGLGVLFRWIADDGQRNMDMARDLVRENLERPAAVPLVGVKLDPEHPDYAELIASNKALLDEMRAERQQNVIERLETVDAAEIADLANVDREAVERVLGRLLADATRRDDPKQAPAVKRARR